MKAVVDMFTHPKHRIAVAATAYGIGLKATQETFMEKIRRIQIEVGQEIWEEMGGKGRAPKGMNKAIYQWKE